MHHLPSFVSWGGYHLVTRLLHGQIITYIIAAGNDSFHELNTGMKWVKVWECEYESLANVIFPAQNIPLNLDGYTEFRVVIYLNGSVRNITAGAVISPRADGNNAAINVVNFSPSVSGGVTVDGRSFVYRKNSHTFEISDGWRWVSPNTYYDVSNNQVKPAYIEAR